MERIKRSKIKKRKKIGGIKRKTRILMELMMNAVYNQK